MSRRIRVLIPKQSIEAVRSIVRSSFFFLGCLLLLPVVAHAQSGSPFDTGFSNMQTLFTGTVAKVASLIAIVIGGYALGRCLPTMLTVKEGATHPFDIVSLAGLHWKTTGTVEERRDAFRVHWKAIKDRPPLVSADPLVW